MSKAEDYINENSLKNPSEISDFVDGCLDFNDNFEVVPLEVALKGVRIAREEDEKTFNSMFALSEDVLTKKVKFEATRKIEQEIKDEIFRKHKAGYSTPKIFNNKVQGIVYLEGFEDGLVFIEKFFKERFLVKSKVQLK